VLLLLLQMLELTSQASDSLVLATAWCRQQQTRASLRQW
jgi:hypothetical protein